MELGNLYWENLPSGFDPLDHHLGQAGLCYKNKQLQIAVVDNGITLHHIHGTKQIRGRVCVSGVRSASSLLTPRSRLRAPPS